MILTLFLVLVVGSVITANPIGFIAIAVIGVILIFGMGKP